MQIVIRGHHLPGTWFRDAGVPIHNVHVGVQIGDRPDRLVAGDAESAEWVLEVRVRRTDDGLDVTGPGVHGRRGERFVYLTWGDVGQVFNMFRRAKLMLGAVDPALVDEAESSDRPLVATIDLIDRYGGPVCGRVGPPALTWSVGDARIPVD